MAKTDYLILILLLLVANLTELQSQPIRIGIAGLTHTHVHGLLGQKPNNNFVVVGIAEPNRQLAVRYCEQYGIDTALLYPTLSAMLADKNPDAVTAFGSIYDHLAVVQAAAPRGIHVMVEKPLAISLLHAQQMKQLADSFGIELLTNYETTWYAANHAAYRMLQDGAIGALRKIVVRDGHKGPLKIGINKEFLNWLTDPAQNGAGALMDFGCYGANLATWLLRGAKPVSVTAVTHQLQPQNNPLVDDEATIIINYDTAQVIIQASWNWPIGRKDMEVYGLTGALYADNANTLRRRLATGYDSFTEEKKELPPLPSPLHGPFEYLSAVLRQRIVVANTDLSSLSNNMLVMEILDAAMQSARIGKTIYLRQQ